MSSLLQSLEAALRAAAAEDGRALAPLSFTVDYGTDCDSPVIEARVDRATRSLVFVRGEARAADGALAASASAVFRTA